MNDAFALLEFPRQPWLEPEALKQAFLNHSTAMHPDKFLDPTNKESAQARFAELNQAHEILRDPKRRLQHLLTLERGQQPKEVHDILPETAALFLEVGQLLKPIDTFLAEREAETSPLLKAQTFPQALDWLEKTNALLSRVQQELQTLDAAARKLNAQWDCEALERLFHQYSYLQKWRSQLNERAVRLGL